MPSTLRALLTTLMLVSLAACGGGEEDDSSELAPASSLAGTWYSAAVKTSYTFNGTGYSGTGTVRTRSNDGGSCQITDINYSVNTSAGTVTYTITRAAMTGNSAYNYDSAVSGFPAGTNRGPFTERYTASNNSVTIGNGTYTAGSMACS